MKTSPFANSPFQNIPQRTSSSAYLDKLVGFLEKSLPDFPKVKRLEKNSNENDLTEDLYNYLAQKARQSQLPFEFRLEKTQKMPKGHDKGVDLAVRINTYDIDMELVYCIEARKLPTDRPGGIREKEYAVGNRGSIERFKKGAHGKDDAGHLLPQNGIVAYVTDHNFLYWHHQINQWMKEAGWPFSESVRIEFFTEIGRLTSTHPRVSGDSVQLDHFWVCI